MAAGLPFRVRRLSAPSTLTNCAGAGLVLQRDRRSRFTMTPPWDYNWLYPTMTPRYPHLDTAGVETAMLGLCAQSTVSSTAPSVPHGKTMITIVIN